jgi:hypothetical protein
MPFKQDESNFKESTVIWRYIRKPEPAPEPTIEERLERIEAALAKLQKP